MKGGEIIASGSYGCVFYPSLKCITNPNTNEITKLMTKKDGMNEYILNLQIKQILKNIPNYSKYFIFIHSKCNLENITENDLNNYSKCGIFDELKIPRSDIFFHKDKFLVLNQRFGGIEFGELLEKNILSKKMNKIINMGIVLLTNAIIPMNKLKVYHFDLKTNNIMSDKNLGIIDWGLAMINPDLTTLSNSSLCSKFIFNLPFSNVIFSHKFHSYYNKNDVEGSVADYLNNYEEERHLKLYKKIFALINPNENIIDCIKKYLLKILNKYTIEEYLEIYLFNVDIWGFMTFIVNVLEIIKSYALLETYYKKNITIIRDLANYLYTATEKINVQLIITKLKKVSILFGNKTIYTRKNNILRSKSTTFKILQH